MTRVCMCADASRMPRHGLYFCQGLNVHRGQCGRATTLRAGQKKQGERETRSATT